MSTASSAQNQHVLSLVEEISKLKSIHDIQADETARIKALTAARNLTLALQRPEETCLHNAFLPLQSACVRIAVDLQLFQFVADGDVHGRSLSDIVAYTKAEPFLLVRLLRVLVATGFIGQVDEESYSPTTVTKAMTRPELQAGTIHHFDLGMLTEAKLPEFFRKYGYKSPTDVRAGPFQYAFNTSLTTFDWWAQYPEFAKNFNTFMTAGRASSPKWVNWFPAQEQIIDGFDQREDAVLMVDVGGGKGHDLQAFAVTFPRAPGRLILQDLPDVIDDPMTLDSRIERVKHNFFEQQPIRGSRVYFLHSVLHDWPDNDCASILSNIAAVMTPGYSKILLNEYVLADKDCQLIWAEMDWAMMTLHSGMERSEKHWHKLAKQAGLQLAKIWRPAGIGNGIIELVLP